MAEQAQEMVVDATPKKKAFMDKPSTHEERIKRDEEELEDADYRQNMGTKNASEIRGI